MKEQHLSSTKTAGKSLRGAIMDRRKFFNVLGTGIAVTFTITQGLGFGPGRSVFKDDEDLISAWIHVGSNGTVTVYTGKAEVGQNIRTSLAQIVAEELEVSVNAVNMVLGDTDLTPYDRGTFGSRSIPYMGPELRKAAASAREYLIEMAATKWKASRDSLKISDGIISNPKNQKFITIGELTGGNKLIKPINKSVKVKTPGQWQTTGKSIPKVNGESFLTGKHKYVSDLKLPEMLYGKVLRAPSYGATLVSIDTSQAEAMPGVTVLRDGEFVGVAAPTHSIANRALLALMPTWKTTPQASRGEIFTYLKENAQPASSRGSSTSGDASEAFDNASVKLEQSFNIDYIAHAPLEPRAGVALWSGEKLTVWAGTQRPFGVQEELVEVFRIPKENVRVIMPDTGSGYGGKHTGEAGIEAARLAKAAGKPVKVIWSREEEFTWAYFRPAGVIDVKAGANKEGKVIAWEFHNYNSGGSGIETPYDVRNKKIQYHPVDSPLRQGSYRGLAATANVFARESIMNDLAEELNLDPLEFRIRNLTEQRMIDVLNAAADKFEWSRYKPRPNHGIGIGCGDEKGSYVATCAEVAVDPGTAAVKVIRVSVAFECGAIINPSHLENQIVGSVIQGLGGALFEKIDFKDGKILNPAFSQYRVPRFSDIPKIDTVMVNRTDIPSLGAGETPILGIAPAVRNAISHATGKKLYTLPLVPEGLPL